MQDDDITGLVTGEAHTGSLGTFNINIHSDSSHLLCSLFTSGPASAAYSPGRPAAAGSPRSGGCCGSGESAPRPANTRLFASYFKLFSTIWN